jgi:hypothetical protein
MNERLPSILLYSSISLCKTPSLTMEESPKRFGFSFLSKGCGWLFFNKPLTVTKMTA